MNNDFWLKLDELVGTSEVRIDRPKGSPHPRYPDLLYPLDYGYLVGTTSGDGGGVDVWVGSLPERRATAIICAVDLKKRDAEIKVLLGCTPEEAREVLAIHNSGDQAGMLIEREEDRGDPHWLRWARDLQAMAQSGLTYTTNPFEIERYKAILDIAAQIAATYSQLTLPYVRRLYTEEVGHATPKVDVRGVVFRGDDILLVKENADGLWTVPGGWADVNESPAEATVREVYEESGFRTRAVKLLAVYDRSRPEHGHPPHLYHIYKIFFLCEIVGGEAARSIETDDVGFFHVGALPNLSQGRVTARQIARFFEHYRHPEWPTDFD